MLMHRSNKLRICGQASLALLLMSMVSVGGSAQEEAKPKPSLSLSVYVRAFESSYRNVRSLRAQFTQTYTSGGRSRVESGTVYFARGGLMRWDYREPEEKLFVCDGKYMVLYVPEEKQATRTPVKSSEDIRVPFRLLLSRLNLRRVFSRIEFADAAMEHDHNDTVLRAYPKEAFRGDYLEVLMELTPGYDVRRLVIVYPDRSTMKFRFDRIVRNVSVRRTLFRFTPPPDTEVIDQK
jgi:chaperone LolA